VTGSVPPPYPGDPAHRVICQQVVELLTEYLDGVLGEPLQADVDAHLAACPECLLFLEQLETAMGMLGQLPVPDDLPDGTMDALVREFRDLASS
jgi:predicted anti-sigma-YlaC factor YlaD